MLSLCVSVTGCVAGFKNTMYAQWQQVKLSMESSNMDSWEYCADSQASQENMKQQQPSAYKIKWLAMYHCFQKRNGCGKEMILD